jgi:hypothetical protein
MMSARRGSLRSKARLRSVEEFVSGLEPLVVRVLILVAVVVSLFRFLVAH